MAENYPAEESSLLGVGEVMELGREHRMGLHADPHPHCPTCRIDRLIGKGIEQSAHEDQN